MGTSLTLSEESLAILRSLPFGVYVCDVDCIVRFINDAYASYLGVSPQKILGRSIYEFIGNSRARHVMSSRKSELYDEISVRREMLGKRILVNRIPLINDSDEVFGYISQIMSIGDRGWTDILAKMDYAEKALRRFSFASSQKAQPGDNHEIIGASRAVREVIDRTILYAATEEPVLIIGPTGVGKELFANAVHKGSSRAQKPMISLNCATLSREFINSELFGYAPGAFTGAARNGKIGLMELADGGTLFLDEIGELPLEIQGSLLRALETHTIQRVNDLHPRKVNFRLVCATNRNLPSLVRDNLFRADLYYRISTLTIDIPPLSGRTEDISILIQHFLDRLPVPGVTIDEESTDILKHYAWPGNVRELRNVITCAAINSGYQCIRKEYLPRTFTEHHNIAAAVIPSSDGISPINAGEKEIIRKTLEESDGNISLASRKLKISRATLYTKIRKYGL